MTLPDLPIIISPEALQSHSGEDNLVILDLCQPEAYIRGHLKGARYFEYPRAVSTRKPVVGLLPEPAAFGAELARAGITPETCVVAYDDEGGGRAGRLLWTLMVAGHKRLSLVDGGVHAWAGAGLPLTDAVDSIEAAAPYPITFGAAHTADRAYILAHLDDADFGLLDARTPQEYSGAKKLAERGGHIPGAANLNWTDCMDTAHDRRLKSEDELKAMLDARGLTPDKKIVCYCHSHHRSALSFMMLKSLGYEHVRGYPGSWSDWGNISDTPVET